MCLSQEALLEKFLNVELRPKKSVYMKRFELEFELQAVDQTTVKHLRQRSTIPSKQGQKQDQDLFLLLLIEEGCIFPNWRDKKILSAFGDQPTDAIQKRLLPGEIEAVAEEISKLSGFFDPLGQLEEAKNS